jgi:hypothetical protein
MPIEIKGEQKKRKVGQTKKKEKKCGRVYSKLVPIVLF